MRYISPTNLTYLQGQYLQLCVCVKLTLRTGEVRGFTDLDVDITVDGVLYRAKVGLAVGPMQWTNRTENTVTEFVGIFSSLTGGITEADARIGLYNEALVEIFLARWDNSTLVVPLKRGRLASIIPDGTGYTAKVRSLAYPLGKKLIVRSITLDCTAELGDSRCGVTAASFDGVISSWVSPSSFVAAGFAGPADEEDLIGGKLVLIDSDYDWFVNQIKTYDGASKIFTFWKPFPESSFGGWDFTAYEGCRKRFTEDCKDRYDNVLNFRGFPHCPDRDQVVATGPTMDNGGYVAGDGEAD